MARVRVRLGLGLGVGGSGDFFPQGILLEPLLQISLVIYSNDNKIKNNSYTTPSTMKQAIISKINNTIALAATK